MTPLFDHRAVRVGAAAGALGATCALTVGVHSSAAKTTDPAPLQARTQAVLRSVPWTPGQVVLRGAPWLTNPNVRLVPRRSHVDPAKATLRRMVSAGDRIARLPYVWGGGHGSFDASGYDCSGSVSYVLHAGGLLSAPMDSSGLEGFGLPGPGRHVTIYANAQHALMVIDGRRFDTIALQETGTRWSPTIGPTDGYTVRHPAGL